MKLQYYVTGILLLTLLVLGGCSTSYETDNQNTRTIVQDVSSNSEVSESLGDSEKVTIYFFWGDGCPHCASQKPYLDEWERKYSDKIEIKMFETWKNPDNVPIFQEVSAAYGIKASGVPTTFIGEKNWVGFSDGMAGEMETYIQNCIENKCENPLD